MENKKIKPGIWLYFLAGAIDVIGILFIVFSIINLVNKSSNMERVVIPGNQEVYLEKSGDYIIYHEFKSNIDGKYYFSKNLQGLDCKIIDMTSNQTIPIDNNIVSSNYSWGGKEGRAIFKFNINTPGSYRFDVRLTSNEQTVLAIGQGNMVLPIMLVSISIIVFAFLFLISKALIIITFVMRRRNKF